MLTISDGAAGRAASLFRMPQPRATKPDPVLFSRAVDRAKSEANEPAAICGAPGGNRFERHIDGPDPNLAVGGSHDEQERQRDVTLALAGPAGVSYLTGHTPLTPRMPSDGRVQDTLGKLGRNPPIGRDGGEVTRATYRSHIPNASASEAYRHFVENPGQVFGAGGMEVRPPAGALENGGRYMLEAGGPPPVWLPVEIALDPANNALTIHTLDGHPLRGEQTFTFKDDGAGGTTLTQDARYQAGSTLVGKLQRVASISEGQHLAWQHAHQEIYGQFNCDPDYEGIGTSDSPELQQAYGTVIDTVVQHPSIVADAGIDAGGVAANAGIDWAGREVQQAVDTVGAPGGRMIEAGFDAAGDKVEVFADKAGDVAGRFVHSLLGR